MTGKECAVFTDTELKTLVKENDLDVEGFSCCPSERGVPGIRRIVLSPSRLELFALILRCGNRFLIDDFVLVELGLGGSPALVELGLGDMVIRVEEGIGFSIVRAGICIEERCGRRE